MNQVNIRIVRNTLHKVIYEWLPPFLPRLHMHRMVSPHRSTALSSLLIIGKKKWRITVAKKVMNAILIWWMDRVSIFH